MKTIAVTVAAAIGLAIPSVATAQSEMPPLVQNPNITVEYEDPRHPIYAYAYDHDDARVAAQFTENVKEFEELSDVRNRLMKRRVLEEFSQFLAPLKLPIPLQLVGKQCDQPAAIYDRANSRIILCYELVAAAEIVAPKTTTAQGITREDAIIGITIGLLLHETGNAVINLLRVPVLGRQEDAADQIATYVMLQLERDTARTLIKGYVYLWTYLSAQQQRALFSSDYSPSFQRLQMTHCLAYGADPEGYSDLMGAVSKERAEQCASQYRQIQHAFRTTVLPHVDEALMKQVQARKWLRPEDAKRP